MTEQIKSRRKTYIKWISSLIGCLIGLLLTWAILRVSVADNWTLGKAVFASEEKIMDHVPKINEVDEKLKKSIVAKPLNFLSKKVEEEAAKEVAKGNLGGVVSALRFYSLILILIWFLVWTIIWVIFYYLSRWIIGSFVWKETNLEEA